jgi:hypothetical protein
MLCYKCNDGLPGYNVNASDDQQPEFRNLSEFYIIIFLNQQKLVVPPPLKKKRERKTQNKNVYG